MFANVEFGVAAVVELDLPARSELLAASSWRPPGGEGEAGLGAAKAPDGLRGGGQVPLLYPGLGERG